MTGRRTILKVAIAGIHGGIGLLLGIPGLRFLLHPLRREREQAPFRRLIPLNNLPAGKPLRVVVHAERRDAYIHHPPGPIGSVWLIREPGQVDPPRLRCLQTVCPHLGCGVDYLPAREAFSCPCHVSEFDRTGKAVSGPSPRPMDELECRIAEPDEQGRRWVEARYQEFQTGVAERRTVV